MNIAVILAGGTGSRMGLKTPKQFLNVAGKTIIEHTVDAFFKNELIDEIAIVIHKDYVDDIKKLVLKNGWSKVKKILNGGNERYESSLLAINAYKNNGADNIIFHDAARPLVNNNIIDNVIKTLEVYNAVTVAVQAVDTIITCDINKKEIKSIPQREYLMHNQTPQAFKGEIIKRAYEIGMKDPDFTATDDCTVVKKYLPEVKIGIVIGDEKNIKMTHADDIIVIEEILKRSSRR